MTRNTRYESTSASDYPTLREALAPQYRHLPTEDLEALFESYDLSAEDIEGFFDTLKDIGNAVVNAAPTIIPIAATALGAFGGPPGMMLGNTLGNLAAGAIRQATAPSPAPAQRVPPRPPMPQLPPGASPAAAQMMQATFRPETLQALLQMLLGQLGASNVMVGSTPVPVGAFPNLVGAWATQAQAEYNATQSGASEELPEYLRNYAGEASVDPAVAEHRARALHELLLETDTERVSVSRQVSSNASAYEYEEETDEEELFYTEMELVELDADAGDW